MAHYTAGQKRERTRVRHAIEYALLRGVGFPLVWLPLGASLWIGRRLGDFVFSVLRMRRRVALENLRRGLGPEPGEAELERIARAVYRNMGMTFVEFLRFERERRDDLMARTEVGPLAVLEQAQRSGRGVIFLTAHTGDWEVCGVVMGVVGGPLSTVVGDQKNLWVDRYIKTLRVKVGMRIIPIGSALREVMRLLAAGGRGALAADQDAGGDGLLLEFLGRPASCSTGPARFAYRSGAAVVIGLDRHLGGGRHRLLLHPPIVPDPSRPEEEEVARILTEFNHALEAFVRRHPDQWFWMHRRWKSGTERVAAGETVRGV
jgi:Kdo2-lipid IVA lauroyltransferase/acyltransferase